MIGNSNTYSSKLSRASKSPVTVELGRPKVEKGHFQKMKSGKFPSPQIAEMKTGEGMRLRTPEKTLVIARYHELKKGGERNPTGRGAVVQTALEFGVTRKTVHKYLKAYGQVSSAGRAAADAMQRSPRSGRPSMLTEDMKAALKAANKATGRTGTYQDLAQELEEDHNTKFSPATVRRWSLVCGAVMKRRWIKPWLSDYHKRCRLEWILNEVGKRNRSFSPGYDTVHLDEKWFYLMKDGRKIRMFPDEAMPNPPKCRHKSHIPKVMYICVVGRPRPDKNFDGLIGIWRSTEVKMAKKNSKNHKKGDLYDVDCTVTAASYRKLLEEEIVPAIHEKMDWIKDEFGDDFFLQHDGASPHTGKGNREYFREAAEELGLQVVTQPAQSPDMNVLDLGFFASLQARVQKAWVDSVEKLDEAVRAGFWSYPSETLEKVWQALFNCYNKILDHGGDNNYKIPHVGVSKSQRHGVLTKRVAVTAGSIENGEHALEELVGAEEDDVSDQEDD